MTTPTPLPDRRFFHRRFRRKLHHVQGRYPARYLEVVTQTAKAIFATRDDEKKRELGEAIMDCWESAPTRQQ